MGVLIDTCIWIDDDAQTRFPIDAGTAEVFGELAAHLADGSKRRYRTRVQNLWMASQAVPHGLELMTRNQNDFLDIPGVDLILPKETRP